MHACIIKKKNTLQFCEIEDWQTSSKLIFASCVWYSDRAYYWACVLIEDIGRRLPLELQQCSLYQGQQGDVSQSVRGNHKTRFWRGQNLTAVEGKAPVYQVYPASRTTDEGQAEIFEVWGPGAGGGGVVEGGGNLTCAAAINPWRGQMWRLWEERISLSCISCTSYNRWGEEG